MSKQLTKHKISTQRLDNAKQTFLIGMWKMFRMVGISSWNKHVLSHLFSCSNTVCIVATELFPPNAWYWMNVLLRNALLQHCLFCLNSERLVISNGRLVPPEARLRINSFTRKLFGRYGVTPTRSTSSNKSVYAQIVWPLRSYAHPKRAFE